MLQTIFTKAHNMATNTGNGYRKGAVKKTSQFKNPVTGLNCKRDAETGRIKSCKTTGGKYKGVRRE
jgi:hypothetical protein